MFAKALQQKVVLLYKSVTLTWLKINIFKIHICYSKENMFRNNFSWGEK